jgi:hypothetical protein
MEVLLIAAAIFGRFLLILRRQSLGGYFGPPGSEPGIFEYAGGRLIIGGVGFVAQWGSTALLVASGEFYAAGLAQLLAFLTARPLFRLAYGTDAKSRKKQPGRDSLSGPSWEAARALPAEPAIQAVDSHSPARPESTGKYGLGGLHAGIPVEAAIQILLGACNKHDTMYITEGWITPRLAQLKSGLANPITEDQAQALCDAVLQRRPFKDLLHWLEGEPISWKDYQTKTRVSEAEAKRMRGEKIRRNWDWEKAKRLREAGYHVCIPPEVMFDDRERNNSDPDVPKK